MIDHPRLRIKQPQPFHQRKLQRFGGLGSEPVSYTHLLGDVNPSWLFWIDAFVGRKSDIAFTGSTPTQPSELYYMSSANDTPRRLTNFNQGIAALKLGKAEKIEWQGPDNFNEDGVVVYPPDFDKAKKYPLVLYIHGGPTASSITGFGFFPQLLAARGYIVFSPNYRGSDNLGNAYQRAIWNDAGDGPGDVYKRQQ